MSMKTIFENVIKKGGYDLTALLAKVDSYHIEGKLTDEERNELYALARTSPEAQYDIKAEIEQLWAAVKALQGGGDSYEGETESEVVAEWKQPTGVQDSYMTGAKVLYNGRVYKSLIDYNVWSPDVYPAGWEEVV